MTSLGGNTDTVSLGDPYADMGRTDLPNEAIPVFKLESGSRLPASELAEAERKLGQEAGGKNASRAAERNPTED